MRQLAARLGVSTNTLRAAQAVLAHDGLLEIRHGSGVFVTSHSRRQRIGILSEIDLFDSRIGWYWRSLTSALKSRLEAGGADVVLYIGHAERPCMSDDPTCPSFWTDAAAGKLDGAVILVVPSTKAWRNRICHCPVPCVGTLADFNVESDFAGITAAAVRRLAAQGCRRLGLLSWHMVEPFRQAVQECGLETRDAWIRTDLDPSVGGAGWDEFREIWSAPERPDGLVILDDMLFADAQLAMAELDVQVPRDLKLTVLTSRGAAAPVRVPHVGMEIDPAEIAAGLVEMLGKRMSGELVSPTHKLSSFREVFMERPGTASRRAETTSGAPAAAAETSI